MQLEVRLFATLRDRAKANPVAVELTDGATVGALREKLATDYPALAASLPTCLVAVNQEFAFADTPLHPGDEVALFPPVSGGADWPTIVRITPDGLTDEPAFDVRVQRQDDGDVRIRLFQIQLAATSRLDELGKRCARNPLFHFVNHQGRLIC